MTLWQIPGSQTTTVDLGTTDSAFVQKGVAISAPGIAIYGTGAQQSVEIYGWVAAGSVGVDLEDATADGNSVLIGDDARVTSFTYALKIHGTNAEITNHGVIDGRGAFAIIIGTTPASAAPTATIVNTGTISGQAIICRDFDGDTGLVTLDNSGTITATSTLIASFNSTGAYAVTNSGQINGAIAFAVGADTYDGQKGHITGSVSGMAGADVLNGGTENNTFDGGADSDKLCGGGGADQLTGGTGADVFLFKALADSTVAASGRDTISDFSETDGDTIDLHAIDANANKHKNQSFQFIEGHAFHHVAGELRFHTSSTDTFVFGDVNGDGKADFAIKLAGLITLHVSDFVL